MVFHRRISLRQYVKMSVISSRIDAGDAHLADLTVGQRVVGVVAHLGRQVEGNRQPRSARGQQLPVPLIGRCGSLDSV